MSVYSTADEERIRAGAQVRAWTQSGLLDAAQTPVVNLPTKAA